MGDQTPEKPQPRTPEEILNEPAICVNCIHHRRDTKIFEATGETISHFCTHPEFEPDAITDPVSGEKRWGLNGTIYKLRWPNCFLYNKNGDCHRFEPKPEDWDESRFEGWRAKNSDRFP